MSKKCIWCGSEVNPNVVQGMYYCPHCDEDLTDKDVLPMTLFEYITQSVEKLAECSVCKLDSGVYYSHFTGGFYTTENKAIAATIEELKKEYKENDTE